MKQKFKFYTQYNQFFIEDKKLKTEINQDIWNEEAFIDGLAFEEGIISVRTRSYGNIKGEIEILNEPIEKINYELYDHIVEGEINISSGELQILDCPNSHLEVSLKLLPGHYRVRIYESNFESVKETDLVNDADDDFYRIEIWPDEKTERKVLKQSIYYTN